MGLGAWCYVKTGTGAMAYKTGTGAMIYKAWVSIGRQSYRRKYGDDVQSHSSIYPDEDVVMATAVTEMQGASWGAVEASAYEYTNKYVSSSRVNTACQAHATGYQYNTSSYNGKTLTGFKVNISNAISRTVIIQVVASSASSWDDSWANCFGSPQYTGSGTGDISVTGLSITLSTYLRIFLAFETYEAPQVPSPPGTNSNTVSFGATTAYFKIST